MRGRRKVGEEYKVLGRIETEGLVKSGVLKYLTRLRLVHKKTKNETMTNQRISEKGTESISMLHHPE